MLSKPYDYILWFRDVIAVQKKSFSSNDFEEKLGF